MNSRPSATGVASQRGATLIVALVMLVIIALMSVAVMRGALTSDLIANNARAQTQAQQYAELALRYCERCSGHVVNPSAYPSCGTAGFAILPPLPDDNGNPADGLPTRWGTFANWFGGGAVATTVPGSALVSSDSPVKPPSPQCLAEYTVLNDGTTQALLVTARGFSPDFQQDAQGRTTAGSVVWLQSISRIN